MRTFPDQLQVCILGAGPAGICAALRLVEMGHTVGIIESETFPRKQIGESLSPTVRNIFAYLHAEELLNDERFLHHLPSNVIWENEAAPQPKIGGRPSNIVVDRGILDQQLLTLAVSRGVHLLQPTKTSNFRRNKEGWSVEILSGKQKISFHTNVLLDARGKTGSLAKERIPLAPSSVAVWTHLNAGLMPEETFVEAFSEGWLWGAKIPGNQYRVMTFTAGKTILQYGAQMLSELSKKTYFFNLISKHLKNASVESCSVTPFVHQNPWDAQFIKLGEAAFALDPLSSNGVEKAMRFSLQVAVAVNTFLKCQDVNIAKAYYEEKLIESVCNHSQWTASFYQSAWPYRKQVPFWKNKAEMQLPVPSNPTEFYQKLQEKFYTRSISIHPAIPATIPMDLVLNQIWNTVISPSPLITFKEVFVVNNDYVEIKPAICHPSLEQPVTYLEQLDLRLLLTNINGKTVEMAVKYVNGQCLLEKAKKIIFHLWLKQLIMLD